MTSARPTLAHVQLSGEAEQFISSATPFWKPDTVSEECDRCFTAFSWRVRRHHCRDCGGCFCADCTPHRVALPYRPGSVTNSSSSSAAPSTEKQRVCTYCWFFLDMHQKQEHDRQNEARRMQQRAQDEGFMRRMADSATGGVEQLRQHMQRELLGRSRAALGHRSTRSIAATSTKWSGSDDDGEEWAVAYVPPPDSLTRNDDACFRNNIIDREKQWNTSLKKQQQEAQKSANSNVFLRDLLMAPPPRMPAPSMVLFSELSEKCGVNPTLDANSTVGQSVIATTTNKSTQWQRVTEESLMDENNLVGVAAYFRT